MTIFLIRHGETPGNKSRRVQTPDTPLSETGRRQAALLATRLASENITRILSSDYIRTRETVAPLSQLLSMQVTYSPLLRERNFGDLRGRQYDDIGVDFFAQDYTPTNGESWHVFEQRVQHAWQEVLDNARKTSGNLAVITHGLVCLKIVSNHTKTSETQSIPMHWGNTSVTEIELGHPHNVSRLNCSAHLLKDNLHTTSGGKV